ncbi:SCO family protein [Geminicoccus roseus]|uniref:SCO family protein n=1 Tax=Geminicoccus roseus TaxID=404900 RepID=UPI0004198890|nr:SCO family protein [Geminicoccus roseus]
MHRRLLFTGGAGALAGTAVAAALGGRVAEARRGHPKIPDVEVVDQDGNPHLFYSDLVANRIVLVNFFFQTCGDICPLVSQNLREVQDLLADRMGRDIFMYSITLQPEFDQPHILKAYARQWDAQPGWSFLTGAFEDIERLRRAMGFASSDPLYDLILDNHTGTLRYGNARIDRWAATPALARPAWIAKAVTSIAGQASA